MVQGCNQEKVIDYDEIFDPITRIEGIKICIAFVAYIEFKVFQINFKSVFLNGYLKGAVYAKQPPRFEDIYHTNHVMQLEIGSYVLKKALTAWYESLSKLFLEYGFDRGIIDNILFLKSRGTNLLIFQVYVDDIIFWSNFILSM